MKDRKATILHSSCTMAGAIYDITTLRYWFGSDQARNQLGSPGGAKNFLRGAQIF